MNLRPREDYFVGGIVKSITKGIKGAVKGAAKTIKKVAKSPIGKAAIIGGLGMYAGGLGPFASGSSIFGGKLAELKGAGFLKNIGIGGLAKKFSNMGTLGKTAAVFAGGSLLGGLMSKAQQGDEEAIAATQDVGSLRSYLESGYRNLGYDEKEIPSLVEQGVSEYTSASGGYASGGRVEYGDGTPDDLYSKSYERVMELMDEGYDFGSAVKKYMEETRDEKAMGGRIGFAMGPDNPETNAIQAAGIEGLPLNQNPAGVTELDLRDSGGFIPPVGVKEKADDIPAMLANNEFVFTADAVRGMGEGNVNKGAQRMYDMMKKLEKGGRV